MCILACGSGGGGVAPSACDDGAAPQMIKGDPVTADQPNPLGAAGAVSIVSQNGDVTVLGDSTDDKVHITATPFVMATSCDSGVEEALADIAGGIRVAPSGATGCSYASHAYGDVARASTGCTDVVIHVPPGTVDQPLRLSVHTFKGSLEIRNVNLADHDCFGAGPDGGEPITCPLEYLNPPTAQADVGDVTITGVTGSVYAVTSAGSITVADAPNPPRPEQTPLGDGILASYVVLSATSGDASLSLPNDFAADSLSLAAYKGTVTIDGFPDVGQNSLSRGTPGTGARMVWVNADQGNTTLEPLD